MAVKASVNLNQVENVYTNNIEEAIAETQLLYNNVDYVKENDGSIDIWGEDLLSRDFRLRLIEFV